MQGSEPIEFRVLGPLEVRAGGHQLSVGGAKQRAVLGLLLLSPDAIVPVERIIDGVWGEQPPPSAAHTVEGYVSRLRREIEPYGASVVRQGGGYRLELGGGRLDALLADDLLRAASDAASAGDHERAADLAQEALALWRGPAMGDAELHGGALAAANELNELRMRVLERLVEEQLALARHDEAAALLRPLVAELPYRERFVAQLMLALYHGGRRVEALNLYEMTRQRLADDLGLKPSVELQRLSGHIVRHDLQPASERAADGRPSRHASDAEQAEEATGPPRRGNFTSRNAMAVALIATVVAAVPLAVFAIGWDRGSGGEATEDRSAPARIGLVLPRRPTASDDLFAPYLDGLLAAKRFYGVDTETILVDPSATGLSGSVRAKIEDLDLVLLGGPAVHDRFVREVPRNPGTHFVFVDPSPTWEEAQVNRLANSTDIFFIEGPASYLAAYMGGLMERRRVGRSGKVVVSIVAGDPGVSENLVAGFRAGARDAVPGAIVLEDYSHDFSNPSVCNAIANRQIDRGSRVVFAASGTCGLGALSAAAVRGVWAEGVDIDPSHPGSHVLVSVEKQVNRAVEFAIRSFLAGTLKSGSVDIGIERDAVGITDVSSEVPPDIRRAVQAAAQKRADEWASWATP